MVRCHDATAKTSVTKVLSEVFTHFHAVTIKHHSDGWNLLFSLPG
jgi:hypothetical protein